MARPDPSPEFFRSLADASPNALLFVDTTERISYASPRAVTLSGAGHLDDLLGTPIATFLRDEDRDRALQDIATLRSDGVHRLAEYRLKRFDGEFFDARISASVVKNAAGDHTGFATVVFDITELKALEQQIRQGQKMDAIGRLAGGIAHDFNNLLTTILGYCDLLLENRELASGLKPDVDEIKHAATSAASLTQQLLAFSRKQLIEPKNIDVNDLLNRMGNMTRRLLGELLTIDLRLAPGVFPVRIDPGQFEQIFLNLAVNARDAMPQGGCLSVATANVDLESEHARHRVAIAPGPYVMLSVTDTGEGMSREVQARLFEPFFTTKAVGKGTGMGLATVYGIVKQNNGYIWVDSEVGHGTTVKVYLPAVLDGAATNNREPNSVRRLAGTETILVVEDNDRLRELTRRSLQRQGYTTLLAPNGDEAVRIAVTHDGPIQLMFTDVVMPGLSGHQLVEEISRVRPDMKILYCSGYTADAIAHQGVVASGLAFLQKPFTPDGLAKKVREVLDA